MATPTGYDNSAPAHEEEGYEKGLKPVQLQMIAIANAVALLIIVHTLVGGWYAVRGRVLSVAQERVGYTGNYPVVAQTPLQAELTARDNRHPVEPKESD